jgi:hypothetical protein
MGCEYRFYDAIKKHSFPLVLWIRKYFFRIRIRGYKILNYGSEFGRPINYGSSWIRILPGHFCDH